MANRPMNTASSPSFASLLGDLVESVDQKGKAASKQAQDVMLGKSDNIHQAMIAMQEAGVSFNLLVEVRNKLVESYKELTHMQV
jgi:flagellar hook-basal body complex protein FliE